MAHRVLEDHPEVKSAGTEETEGRSLLRLQEWPRQDRCTKLSLEYGGEPFELSLGWLVISEWFRRTLTRVRAQEKIWNWLVLGPFYRGQFSPLGRP